MFGFWSDDAKRGTFRPIMLRNATCIYRSRWEKGTKLLAVMTSAWRCW